MVRFKFRVRVGVGIRVKIRVGVGVTVRIRVRVKVSAGERVGNNRQSFKDFGSPAPAVRAPPPRMLRTKVPRS